MTKSKTLFTLITSLFLFVLSFVSLPVYCYTKIKEQREQLLIAKNTLEQQEKTLSMQNESLAKVNAYLEMQMRELKRIKMQQRNSKILNILLGGTVVYLVAKN